MHFKNLKGDLKKKMKGKIFSIALAAFSILFGLVETAGGIKDLAEAIKEKPETKESEETEEESE